MLVRRAPDDVSLAFTSPKGLVVVRTEGNGGKPMRILLDTGAQRTVVDRTFARSLGLTESGEVKARGSGGTVDAHFVKGLELHGLGDGPIEAVSLSLDAIGRAIGTPIDAILGQDVLGKRVVQIDGSTMRVTFGTHSPLVYSADAVVTLHLKAGRPYLMATIVGPNGGLSDAEMLLDSGSDTIAELAQPYADEVGLTTHPDPSGRRILGVGGSVPLRIADLREVRLGRAIVPPGDVRVFFRPVDSSGDGDGRVGNGFLSHYKATIDGPGLKLVLTPLRKSDS